MIRGTLLAFVLVAIGSCALPDDAIAPVNPVGTYQVILFSAPWCGNCEAYLPAIHKEMEAQLVNKKANTKVTVKVPTGLKQWNQPTPEVTAEYAKSHPIPGFNFEMDEWRHVLFDTYFGKNAPLDLPQVVLLAPEATPDKALKFSGKTTAAEVVANLASMMP